MGAGVIIIMGELDCIDGFIKACIGCAKIEEFIVENG
jgi:hypothetical protein